MTSMRKVLPFLYLFFLLLVLFWQVFFKGFVFIYGDNFHLNIPVKYLLVDAIRHGYFPLWNPYILGGIPYAADLNIGTLHPLNLLYIFFPVPQAYTLEVIVALFLIGCFQYIFLRSLGYAKVVSLTGGVVFMLSGTILRIRPMVLSCSQFYTYHYYSI